MDWPRFVTGDVAALWNSQTFISVVKTFQRKRLRVLICHQLSAAPRQHCPRLKKYRVTETLRNILITQSWRDALRCLRDSQLQSHVQIKTPKWCKMAAVSKTQQSSQNKSPSWSLLVQPLLLYGIQISWLGKEVHKPQFYCCPPWHFWIN